MFKYYLRRFAPLFYIYVGLEILSFIIISIIERNQIDWGFIALFKTMGVFCVEVAIALLYLMIPYTLYLMVLPKKWLGTKIDKILTVIGFAIFVALFTFEDVAEGFFWNEFESSFNFIAVDYLIYTKEVIGNMWESYPIIPIFLGLGIFTFIVTWLFRKKLVPSFTAPSWKTRFFVFIGNVTICVLSFFIYQTSYSESIGNRYNAEVAKDGLYSLFNAFINNELSYRDYYITIPDQETASILQNDIATQGLTFSPSESHEIERSVETENQAITPNVIVVVMESLGSEFLKEFREDGQDVTPRLAELGAAGIFFPKTYATGTRSVRGLEAVSTSIPPLPGMAILRRKNNENLQTMGSIFQEKGYDDRKWIYGGYGYFDNMNYYFGNNGFEVYDRTSMDDIDIIHSTTWGVCDENLFEKSIKEANKSYESGKPFLQFVFTTSNHRPYTYPEGRIDIPSKTGRLGAVKYADWCVGNFIDQAKKEPWFDNTIFVFVADHGAGSAGKQELNPEKHLIPLIFYSPKLITPQRLDYSISQIDTLPTLLGLLNWDYKANFYGKDALKPDYKSRFFISNYQNIGYGEGDQMVVMKPVKRVAYYQNGEHVKETPEREALMKKAIGYYQHASDWRKHLKQDTQRSN